MIAYGMQITANVSDQRYDLGVKYQGQIYFKSALQLVTHSTVLKISLAASEENDFW